jgi:hypothetical protein
MKLVTSGALKIGRRSRERERKRSQSPTNKDKIYLFRKDLNWPKRRYQLVRGPRDDLDQGGAVVPDSK